MKNVVEIVITGDTRYRIPEVMPRRNSGAPVFTRTAWCWRVPHGTLVPAAHTLAEVVAQLVCRTSMGTWREKEDANSSENVAGHTVAKLRLQRWLQSRSRLLLCSTGRQSKRRPCLDSLGT